MIYRISIHFLTIRRKHAYTEKMHKVFTLQDNQRVRKILWVTLR